MTSAYLLSKTASLLVLIFILFSVKGNEEDDTRQSVHRPSKSNTDPDQWPWSSQGLYKKVNHGSSGLSLINIVIAHATDMILILLTVQTKFEFYNNLCKLQSAIICVSYM